MNTPSKIAALFLSATSVFLIAGCSSTGTSDGRAPQDIAESLVPAFSAVLIDVRTPEEFAAGHLEGAVNIPVESVDFADRVVAASRGGVSPIEIYCRSGNRSAEAVGKLSGQGLQDITDLGGYEEAADATGLPTVAGTA